MYDTIALRGATVERLLVWLEKVITLIEKEQQVNPRRPRIATLTAARIDPQDLPLYLRPSHVEIVGLYKQLPDEVNPFGAPVCALGLESVRPADPPPAHCPAAADGNCKGCSCTGYAPVHLWRAESFPLTLHELRWLLEGEFTHLSAPWIPMPNIWLTDTLDNTQVSPTYLQQSRTIRGANLETNRWLEAQLRDLAPQARVKHLFPEWLKLYVDEQHTQPIDAPSSFRRAVQSARGRLAQRTNGNTE